MNVSPSDPPASLPRRIRHAWQRKGWLKPFRNAGILAIGGGAQGVIQLAAIAIASQALGAGGFGTLVLVDTVRRFVGGVLRLRAKETVMRFGARALQDDAPNGAFARMLSFAVWLDVLSAVAGASVILLSMGTLVHWLNITPELADEARMYGLCVVFIALSGSAEAVLRLFDRFDLVALRNVIAPIIQLAGSALGLAVDGGLIFFLTVWFLAYAVARTSLVAGALRELWRHGRLRGLSLHPRHLAGPEPGVWRFAAGTNAMMILGKLRHHGATLAVGALLDPAAAGLVHVARRLGELPGKPVGKVLTPAIFPELARQTAAGKHRKRKKTVWRSTGIAGALGLTLFAILAVFGPSLLGTLFGPEFGDAYLPMVLFGVHGVLRTLTFAFGPLLMSAGRIRVLLGTRIVLTSLELGLMFVLIQHIGPGGVPLAGIIAALLSASVVIPTARHELRRPRDQAPAQAAPPATDSEV